MRCPICKQETRHEGNPYRPFCSERCQLLDLGNWLDGRYRIPGESASQENESERNENSNGSHDDESG